MTNEFERGGEMVDETELRDLLARRRPNASNFAAGVADRLAAKNGGGQTRADHDGWWQRAASWVPGLSATSASGTGGLGKLLATLLSLPAILTFGVFALFFHNHNRLESHIDRANGTPDPFWKTYLRQHAMAALYMALPIAGSLLGLAFMQLRHTHGGTTVIDAATVVVMLAMGLVTFQLGQYARLRGARTRPVAMFVIGLQLTVLFGCVLWVQISGVFDGDSMFGYGASGWAITAGVAACGVASVVLAKNWIGGAFTLFILALLPSTSVFGWPDNSAGAVRERLAAVVERLRPADLDGWRYAAHMTLVLDEAGEPGTDLSAARAAIRTAINNGDDLHPMVWQAADRLGLIDRTGWRTVARQPLHALSLRRVLSNRGSLHAQPFYLAMIRATGELSPEVATRLADRAVMAWPDPLATSAGQLERAVHCITWLDQLGQTERVLAHTEALHALLRSHYVNESDAATYAFPGGFSDTPGGGRPSAPATSSALEIIAHVGCPIEIPLTHVRAYLRHSSRGTIRAPADEPVLMMLARADQFRLTNTVGIPWPGPLEFLIGERMFLAAILLAILSFRAVLLAHGSEYMAAPGTAGTGTSGRGALP